MNKECYADDAEELLDWLREAPVIRASTIGIGGDTFDVLEVLDEENLFRDFLVGVGIVRTNLVEGQFFAIGRYDGWRFSTSRSAYDKYLLHDEVEVPDDVAEWPCRGAYDVREQGPDSCDAQGACWSSLLERQRAFLEKIKEDGVKYPFVDEPQLKYVIDLNEKIIYQLAGTLADDGS